MLIHLDFETYSELDVREVGPWAYSVHPSTTIICGSFASATSDPHIFNVIPPYPLIEAIQKGDVTISAYNTFFEYCIWRNVGVKKFKYPPIPIEKFTCTAALAASYGLPSSLHDVAEVLGTEQKLTEGKDLIKQLCKPNVEGVRNRDPKLIQQLKAYCAQDVIVEREIHRLLKPLNYTMAETFTNVMRMNAYGVPFNTRQARVCKAIGERHAETIAPQLVELTDGRVTKPTQAKRIVEELQTHGVNAPNLQAGTVDELLKTSLPNTARKILALRKAGGKTTVSKYSKILNVVDPNTQRAYGLQRFHAAHTGRLGGQHIQPHNFYRPTIGNKLPLAIQIINGSKRPYQQLVDLFGTDQTGEVLASCVRSTIKAPEGKAFINSDFSGVESVAVAWASEDPLTLAIHADPDKDIYVSTATSIYNKSYDSITDDERFIGKVAELSLGYGGGVSAFMLMAKNYGVNIPLDLAEYVVRTWRASRPLVVDLEHALVRCIKRKTRQTISDKVAFEWDEYLDLIHMQLPSNRSVKYWNPRIERQTITYMSLNSTTHKWSKHHTWGGKLLENYCQAICFDLMAQALNNALKHSLKPILTVHDELLIEVADRDMSLKTFDEKIMLNKPEWAATFPLSCKTKKIKYYGK